MVYDNIKALCDKKHTNISQVEMKAGLAHSTISKWKVHSPTVENLQKVADALGVSIKKLVE